MTATGAARTGIYGGTFNPIHLGHLRAAEEVVERLGLKRMIFVPSARPPHKRPDLDDPIAPAEARLEWVREAVADNPKFCVDSLEVDREGPSYLVDTLRTFRERESGVAPIFVLGCDAFLEIGTWREPENLLALASFAVTTRPPVRHGRLGEWLPPDLGAAFEVAPDGLSAQHRAAGTWIRVVEITALDVSASAIRARVRAGRSVRYLLPAGVSMMVLASGAYRAAGASGEPDGESAGESESEKGQSERESQEEGRRTGKAAARGVDA